MFHSDTPPPGDHSEEYQCLLHESYWDQIVNRPYLWGSFVWVMFDVAASGRNEGDTPGVNDKGLVTFNRAIRKDAFYFYRANWTTDPFVYVTARRWTMRTNPSTKIKVYANTDTVEAVVEQRLTRCAYGPQWNIRMARSTGSRSEYRAGDGHAGKYNTK